MTTLQPDLFQLAQQGDVKAIAVFLNQHLQPRQVAAKVTLKSNSLHIILEAPQVPNQATEVELVRSVLMELGIGLIKTVKIYGRYIGADFPDWDEQFELEILPPNLIELAQQGDVAAIATLVGEWLQPHEVAVKVSFKGEDVIQIMLESTPPPDQAASTLCIQQEIEKLNIPTAKKIKIYGREIGADFPDWQQEFELEHPSATTSPKENFLWDSLTKAITDTSVALTNATTQAGQAVMDTASSAAGAVGYAASSAGEAVVGTVTGIGGAASYAASSAGEAVVGTVTGIGSAASYAATQAGGAVVGTVTGIGSAATQAGGAVVGTTIGAAEMVGSAALQVTDGIGYVLDMISSSPQLQDVTKVLKVDWLLAIIDRVDIIAAEAQVRRLQQKYPHEKPNEIAHRIMLEKVIYVSSTGVASSFLPGFAVAMFAVDLAATTAIQAEMGYQIACAYGFDLQAPARKGEILAIFGLALGSGYAVKAGLGLLRNIPVAGAVVGASTNAAVLYAVGYAACRFYESANPLTSEVATAASQAEGEAYLKQVAAQQIIMDQILAHLVLAGYPGKTWEQILPELKTLNFSPGSIQAIANNIQSPPALNDLLTQVSPDFAVPLLAQCQKVAQMDGIITPEEAIILSTITEKLSCKDTSEQKEAETPTPKKQGFTWKNPFAK